MTRRERAILRLERRRTWAASREADSTRRFNAAHNLVKDIPMGQPILIGHHSERRHRRTLDRADGNMRRGVESAKMAELHTSKAANIEAALDRTIFSDDENAIEALRERAASLRATADRVTALNKLIRKEAKTGYTEGWLTRIGATEEEKRAILRNLEFGWRKSPLFEPYVTANLRKRIATDEKRIKDIERLQARQQRAEDAGGVVIEYGGGYAQVTFSEKPARAILDSLRGASFQWSGGSWFGAESRLPADVRALVEPATPAAPAEPVPAEEPAPVRTIWDSNGDDGETLLITTPPRREGGD